MRRALRSLTGWLLLAAALALLSLGGISHEHKRFLLSAEGKATFAVKPSRLIDELRIDLVDDGDALRYRAYANAALGRPHQSYYVRTAREWLASFAAVEDSDPDRSPVRTPEAPLLPYRDFLVEYPPGFFLVALPPALVTGSAAAYVNAFCISMALCLAGAVVVCARTARLTFAPSQAVALPRWCAVAVLALGTVTTHRYDAAVALALCAMVAAALEERPVLAGAALALAIALKLTPLLLAPVLVAWFASSGRRPVLQFVAATVIATLLLWLPALVLAGPGLAEMLRYHLQRPLQIESTAGSLVGIARLLAPGSVRLSFEFGSLNFAGPLAAHAAAAAAVLGVAAPLAAIAFVSRRILRGDSREAAGAALADGVVLVLIAFMASSKVFSPQYLVWILPLGLLAALRRSRRAAFLLIAVLVTTQVIYPFSYGAASRGEPWVFPIILLRNALLIGFGLWLAFVHANVSNVAASARS
jgi:Glycosyltransferase family 87